MNRLFTVFPLSLALLTGCHSTTKPATGLASNQNVKVYKLRGKVVSTNPIKGEVTLDHEAIPGFMEAMTMPYKLKDSNVLGELHPGDVITADVLVSPTPDADILLDHIVITAQSKPDYTPQVIYHVPSRGDFVPDFELRNQDGKRIRLSQFKGKELLVTFIYTRCPRPDFCPYITRNFAAIDHQLATNQALYNRTHLLCISFDPSNDTPARLRSYGATYMGSDSGTAFSHWDFAVSDQKTLTRLAQFFNVGIGGETDGTITHTLSTTLIGADGKVARFYPGNDWTVEQVLADLKSLS